MQGLIDYFLKRNLFVNLLSLILLIMGGWIVFSMNRAAFPNVDFDIVTIGTIWPGASSQDLEKLLTNPLEESIKEVDGIKEYRSTSVDNRSTITLTLDPNVEDTQDVVNNIRSAVERTQDLPENSEDPIVTELTTSREPIIQWNVMRYKKKDGTYTLSYKQLRDIAEALENRFLSLKGVARIARRGWNDAEIFVDLDPQRMRRYSVGSNDVVRALRNRNVSLPGGDILLGKEEIIVRTVEEFNSAKEISKVPVRANEVGASVKVGDIAYVYEDFKESDYIESTENSQTIALTVVKRESADIIEVVTQSHDIVKEFQKSLPQGVSIKAVNDFSYFVRRRLGVLFSNGLLGLCIVVAVLFLFLGWRTALMVALGIPISFAIAFIVMSYTGVNLNLISMFGLIVVLGIIVDDAIIVSENFYRYIEKGSPPLEAASKGTFEVFAPVLATIVTSIAAFGPLLFMSGIFGKFVFTIPYVVILCLLASLFECFIILPVHLYDMNRGLKAKASKRGSSNEKEHWFHTLRVQYYEPALKFALDHKALCIGALAAVFIFVMLLQALFGRFKLFPSAIDAVYVKLEGPAGLPKEELQRYIKAVGKKIIQLPASELDSFTGRAGIQSKEGSDPFTKRGGSYGMLSIYLEPEVDRNFSADAIIHWLRQQNSWLLKEAEQSASLKGKPELEHEVKELISAIKKKKMAMPTNEDKEFQDKKAPSKESQDDELRGGLVRLEFEKLSGGPPVGKPIAIEILGKNFDTMQKISAQYKKILAGVKGVKDISDSFLPGKNEIRVKVNEDLAAQAGVSVLEVATAITTGFEGSIATSIRRPTEEVDIRVRFAESHRRSLEALKQVSLTNARGNLIPVARLASFEKGKSLTAINHLDGRRLLSITANLEEGLSVENVIKEVDEKGKAIPAAYPQYTIQYSGEHKDTDESLGTLQRSFMAALLIIFMILASLFRSLLQPFVVLSALPFALIGVVLAFFLHGEPFSFMALMGLIGLAGVVVNDSIVLVDFANRLKKENPKLANKEITLAAGSARLRPVLLTTFTTVGGLLPTAYGLGGYDPFLVPMALSFAWGLFFSTILILGLVPIIYNYVLDFDDWRKKPGALTALLEKLRDLPKMNLRQEFSGLSSRRNL